VSRGGGLRLAGCEAAAGDEHRIFTAEKFKSKVLPRFFVVVREN
jgi:hypothetical protein